MSAGSLHSFHDRPSRCSSSGAVLSCKWADLRDNARRIWDKWVLIELFDQVDIETII